MEITKQIEKQIIEYLNMEYGTSSKEEFTFSDLRYIGVALNDDNTICHSWDYGDDKEHVVTVCPFEESYIIGIDDMTALKF